MSNPLDSLELVGDVVADLGEGPCWDPAGGTLYWVDISAGRLHRTVPASGATTTCELGPPVSLVLPTVGGGVLIARRNRLTVLAEDGTERAVAETAARPDIRFNDGATDPQGRVWVGSMCTDEASPIGTLYRLEHHGTLASVLPGVTISNGLGWSPDGGTLYYVDSPTKRIDVLDFTPATGQVSGRRAFADLASASGVPDGLTVDAEGGVWVAVNGSGALHRYAPDGRLDQVVSLPVTHPTSVAFGGPDLGDLYVTTAREPLSPAEREEQPLAGRLMRLRPGPAGIPLRLAVLD